MGKPTVTTGEVTNIEEKGNSLILGVTLDHGQEVRTVWCGRCHPRLFDVVTVEFLPNSARVESREYWTGKPVYSGIY